MGYIESGRNAGAKIHLGGNRAGAEGYFIEPTIFLDTKPEMRICREEIFGPVGVVIKFEDEQGAAQWSSLIWAAHRDLFRYCPTGQRYSYVPLRPLRIHSRSLHPHSIRPRRRYFQQRHHQSNRHCAQVEIRCRMGRLPQRISPSGTVWWCEAIGYRKRARRVRHTPVRLVHPCKNRYSDLGTQLHQREGRPCQSRKCLVRVGIFPLCVCARLPHVYSYIRTCVCVWFQMILSMCCYQWDSNSQPRSGTVSTDQRWIGAKPSVPVPSRSRQFMYGTQIAMSQVRQHVCIPSMIIRGSSYANW